MLIAASLSMGSTRPCASVEDLTALALRVRGEYVEMPGLRLTVPQAARLFGLDSDVARAVLEELRCASVLMCSHRGTYALADDGEYSGAGAYERFV